MLAALETKVAARLRAGSADVRFIDAARLAELDREVAAAFDRVSADCAALLARPAGQGDAQLARSTSSAVIAATVTGATPLPSSARSSR